MHCIVLYRVASIKHYHKLLIINFLSSQQLQTNNAIPDNDYKSNFLCN